MDVFTWSLKNKSLNPTKWGIRYRTFLNEGLSKKDSLNELSKYIDEIYKDFGVLPKDKEWTLTIFDGYLKMIHEKGETRLENGSYCTGNITIKKVEYN